MTVDGYNAFCSSLPHAHHVVQWRGAHVWKVAGKVFAIARAEKDRELAVTFKCTPLVFEVLKDARGVRPAPYLASRGMLWLQRTTRETMSDKDLRGHICESHRLVTRGLPKKVQAELGFLKGMDRNRTAKKRQSHQPTADRGAS